MSKYCWGNSSSLGDRDYMIGGIGKILLEFAVNYLALCSIVGFKGQSHQTLDCILGSVTLNQYFLWSMEPLIVFFCSLSQFLGYFKICFLTASMKTVTNCVNYPESQWSITQEFPDAASNNMNEFLKVTAVGAPPL
jgi:hypothetical protein